MNKRKETSGGKVMEECGGGKEAGEGWRRRVKQRKVGRGGGQRRREIRGIIKRMERMEKFHRGAKIKCLISI